MKQKKCKKTEKNEKTIKMQKDTQFYKNAALFF